MQASPSSTLLCLCARCTSHKEFEDQLLQTCQDVGDWDLVITQAESHGIAPLLNLHLTKLKIKTPKAFRIALQLLCIRHKQANAIYQATLEEILLLFKAEGIQSLLLKGASLCQTVYPEIGLRPMRDIDLLLEPCEARRAHRLLKDNAFVENFEESGEDHFHLPPLLKNVEGMAVCIELHQGIFPKDPPYYTPLEFSNLAPTAKPVNVGKQSALTLSDEDMLWHLFQHGFHTPLTYEPYRLISAADIVSLVESRVDQIDWYKIEFTYPQLLRSLPLFHHLTPWSDTVLSQGSFKIVEEKPAKVGETYNGWPQRKNQEYGSKVNLLWRTLYPGQWWLSLYYSLQQNKRSIWWCRIITHPVHLLRWVKVYLRRFRKKNRGSGNA